jgi:secreted trypsin-like serine protease
MQDFKAARRPLSMMSAALLLPAMLMVPTLSAHAGGPSEPKIVGGEKAAPGEFPWQVALLDAEIEDNAKAQTCGGSLIAPNWVLTAAHCVYDGKKAVPASSVDVLGGTNSLKKGGTRVAVDAIIIHPRWGKKKGSEEDDIALLRLAEPLKDGVKVVPLVTRAQEVELTAAGKLATVSGWGDTEIEGEQAPTDLRKVQVPIITNRVCNGKDAYDGAIKPKMLCAGLAAGGKDSCQGDSGGPMVVSNGKKRFALAGVVSWGEGCADPNKYGVYTRVSRYATWIEKVMAKPEKPGKPGKPGKPE